jgi:hypothetical protein
LNAIFYATERGSASVTCTNRDEWYFMHGGSYNLNRVLC